MSRATFVKLEIAFVLAIPAVWLALSCVGGHVQFVDVYLVAYVLLTAGWSYFLVRVIPDVAVDWFSVGVAATCLFGLAVGMHFFFAWLHREIARKRAALQTPEQEAPPISPWKLRTTLSILGILVLMFVAGISAVGGVHQLVWLKTRSHDR